MKRLAGAWLLGSLLCLTPFTALIVLGWLQRFMQHTALERWGAAPWPSWFRKRGLGLNLKLGLQSLACVWALTLPASMLWLFAWHAGWNISFHKDYEQAALGPLTGLLGILLFVLAMGHVPLALARQAVTGRWRDFFDFGLVRRLARRRRASSALLAALYAGAGFLILGVRMAPTFFSSFGADWTDERVRGFLNGYWFWTTLLALFPAVLLLKWAAARIYASAMEEAVREGEIPAEASLRLQGPLPVSPVRPWPLRAVTWTASKLGRAAAVGISTFCWCAVAAQAFVLAFFNYTPVLGWLNLPLIQIPWMRYVPGV